MNRKEQQNNDRDILYQKDEMTIVVREERVKVDLTKYTEEHDFIFDRVFGDNASN